MRSMTKRKVTTAIQTALDFKGFDDLVELFKAGEQTDSLGNTRNFTTDDLDDMVKNHESFPIVIGHPKVDAPAYGWSSKLVRDGDSLFGKFTDVESQFSDMVEKKRFPNRSLRLRLTDDGFKVAHVGFLGAAAPAIPGLKSLEFSEDDSALDFEFSGYAETVMARMLRRLREYFIDKESIELADSLLPEYELEAIAEDAMRDRMEDNKSETSFNQHQHSNKPNNNGGANVPDTKTYSQQEVDDLLAKKDTDFESSENDLKTQLSTERKARLTTEYTLFVDGAVDEGKLTPAMAAGAVDFMLKLSADAEFEFSQGEGDDKAKTKTNPVDWFKDFVGGLGKTVSLGASKDEDTDAAASNFNGPAGSVVDADRLALDAKAREYMRDHECDYVEAVVAVGG